MIAKLESPGSGRCQVGRSADERLRGAFGRFTTGVTVVTLSHRDETGETRNHGITVNSFTSISLDPALIAVSIGHRRRSHVLLQDRPFTVNVLGAEHQDLAMHFASGHAANPVWETGKLAPRLLGSLCWFECTPWAEYSGGDHTLFLGEVRDFGCRRGDALGFFNGRYHRIPDAVGPEIWEIPPTDARPGATT